ncbi:MAG: hypothetical protein CMB99_12925 [Flavobacteriaceae bacterium]|nr:hypothetical protein [Flavobacteriaceae bacterium]
MDTTKKLYYSSLFLKFLMGVQLILIAGFLFVYFHSMISPETYDQLIVTEEKQIIYKFDHLKVPDTYNEWKESDQLFYYTKLDAWSQFRVIWVKIVGFFIYFFITGLFLKFLKNTNSFEVFFKDNIQILNKIIRLVFFLWLFHMILNLLQNPMTMIFEDLDQPMHITRAKVSFDFLVYYPIMVIFFFALREVFKRGYELKQENDLTI